MVGLCWGSSDASTRAMARPHKRKDKENEEHLFFDDHHKRPKLTDDDDDDDVAVGREQAGSLLAIVGSILEARRRKSTRPLPCKIGKHSVDLVALHSRVHTLGGYRKVTEARLWSSVSEALGFGPNCGPAVKLVYVKYLKSSSDRRSLDDDVDDAARQQQQQQQQQNGAEEDTESVTTEDWFEGVREENVIQQREALRGMLEWIRCAAVRPLDESVGISGRAADGHGDDHDDGWASQCHMLAAKVRSVLWKDLGRTSDGYNQGRQMASLYYEDQVRPDPQTLEKLRATRERLESLGFQPPPGPKAHHGDWGTAGGSYAGHRSGRGTYSESAFGHHNRKRIPVGPQFQAEVPEWVPRSAGQQASSSDDGDRWQKVWPLAGAPDNIPFKPVGAGRPDSCDCPEPGSINCVRLHIDAARVRLKSELGPAFGAMGFDQMGEYVAEKSWTREEERVFRLVAHSHPASKGLNFWDYLPDALPHKTRMELNSYYFNVFMLRRRALQNRLENAKIDSDDDEGELPGMESEESEDDSSDEDDDDEEDSSEDEAMPVSSVLMPLRVPTDAEMLKFRPLSEFNYMPAVEVAHHSRASPMLGLEEEVEAGPDNSHVVLVWDDDKHLETGSLVQRPQWGDEHPHWGARDAADAVPSRQLSPPKEDAARPGAALGDLWSQTMEMAPKREKDKLLSTNGMILELFGDDCECADDAE